MKAPAVIVQREERLVNEALRECIRRKISLRTVKDSADQATVNLQAETALTRQYEVTIQGPANLPYTGRLTKHELRCKLARKLMAFLKDAESDPRLMKSLLTYERID